jgi:hypothetical protein
MKRRLSIAFSLLVLGCASHVANRSLHPLYQSRILEQVKETVRISATEGKAPVIVFDLDDTLYDMRPRTLHIVKAFASLSETQKRYGKSASIASRATLDLMQYDPADSFQRAGFEESEAIAEGKRFWKDQFFSNASCERDVPLPGAVAYVKQLWESGAQIVYLSGRNIPKMLDGTQKSLKKEGFPLGLRTHLILKPRFEMDDLEFKKEAMQKIASLGKVVAAFENEPRNLNALGEAFPQSILVFLDTRHSPGAEAVTQESHWVKNYLPTEEESF